MKRAGGVALLVLVLVVSAACSGSDSSPDGASSGSTTSPTPTSEATSAEWTSIDQRLFELGPNVSFLAASVSPDGTCTSIHEIDATTARPTASQFKVFVLGALADAVADGTVSWDQTLTVDAEDKSLGNADGSLQVVLDGSTVSVADAATKMISISDNTATDLLIELLGRDAVEAKAAELVADDEANRPFLTTKQMFKLHYVPGLADRYLATPADRRAEFLSSSVDPLPFSDMAAGVTAEPRYIDTVEWFATAEDLCRAFAALQQQSTDPALAHVSTAMAQDPTLLGLDPSAWPTLWYKGGSEPGVLTVGWLATNAEGETYFVEAMVSNPDAALSPESLDQIAAISRDAFGLLG